MAAKRLGPIFRDRALLRSKITRTAAAIDPATAVYWRHVSIRKPAKLKGGRFGEFSPPGRFEGDQPAGVEEAEGRPTRRSAP